MILMVLYNFEELKHVLDESRPSCDLRSRKNHVDHLQELDMFYVVPI